MPPFYRRSMTTGAKDASFTTRRVMSARPRRSRSSGRFLKQAPRDAKQVLQPHRLAPVETLAVACEWRIIQMSMTDGRGSSLSREHHVNTVAALDQRTCPPFELEQNRPGPGGRQPLSAHGDREMPSELPCSHSSTSAISTMAGTSVPLARWIATACERRLPGNSRSNASTGSGRSTNVRSSRNSN
jgi:hypothetical protein